MDAEPILLPKISDDRSHFRVRTCQAILPVKTIRFIDGLKSSSAGSPVARGRFPRPTSKRTLAANLGGMWRFIRNETMGICTGEWIDEGLLVLRLPGDGGWPNIRGYGSSARQTARPSTLLLYAHHCGRFGRLAKRLKAYKSIFPKGLQSTQTAGLSLATGVVKEKTALILKV
jgi:hypothetical protein